MKFEKGYSHSDFVEAQKTQGIMNELGYNVGGDDAEWDKWKEKTWGKKSLSAYQSLYNEWSSQWQSN